MDVLILHVLAWPALGVAVLVFGFAPGAVLRLIVLFYRRDHPRRQELLGELYAVPRIERPFWVAEQLEIALFEGLRGRFAVRRPSVARHGGLGYAVGGALVVLLVFLNAVPLTWTAQAFGLNLVGTWLMTFILVVASIGAMLGFEMTRCDARRRGLLVGVVAAGYLALLVLRTEFLTMAGESLPAALLEAVMLTAISVGLVLCGSVVLGRIAPQLTHGRLSEAGRAVQREDGARTPPADDAQTPVRTSLVHREVVEDALLESLHDRFAAGRPSVARHGGLGYAVGGALVVLLVVLDVIPLNWSAQAFGLNSVGTWLVTFILVVASIGAMLGFELTRCDVRRRGLLVGSVAVGYLALLVLRMEFLITVVSEPLLVALLQSAVLTAISAELVLCGSAVLARMPPRPTAKAIGTEGETGQQHCQT